MLHSNYDDCSEEDKMRIRSALARVKTPFETDYSLQVARSDDEIRARHQRVAERIVKYVELDRSWLGRPRGIWQLCALVADDLHIDMGDARGGIFIIDRYNIDLTDGIISPIDEKVALR